MYILPTAYDQFAISGIDFDYPGFATCALGSNDGRSAAGKGIKDQAASAGTVPDRIRDKRNRLDRGVHGKFVHATPLERVYAGVVPNI